MTDHAAPGASGGPSKNVGMPLDPFSPTDGTATELFMIYTSFVTAGFSAEQAMQLVTASLATHMQINAVIAAQQRRDGRDG